LFGRYLLTPETSKHVGYSHYQPLLNGNKEK